jgi:hypothetical protein
MEESFPSALAGAQNVVITIPSDLIRTIMIDGASVADYEASVGAGAMSAICSSGTPGCEAGACPDSYPDICAETALQCDGPLCLARTGNLTSLTRDGVDYALESTTPLCDTWEEAITGPDADGYYSVVESCSPAGTGPASLRVVAMPLSQLSSNGADPIWVAGFATFWLNGYGGGMCVGNDCSLELTYIGPGARW